jgi:hypothetical protein
MTVTHGVEALLRWPDSEKRRAVPIFAAGRLLLDQTGAFLYGSDSNEFLPIQDDLAFSTLRDFFAPSGEYLGEALLQAFREEDDAGVSLVNVYSVQLYSVNPSRMFDWGNTVNIRPVPPQHDRRS